MNTIHKMKHFNPRRKFSNKGVSGQALTKMTLNRPEFNPGLEPCAIHDLSYNELIEMIGVISDPDSDEKLQAHLIRIIDATLPGSDVSNLSSYATCACASQANQNPAQSCGFIFFRSP